MKKMSRLYLMLITILSSLIIFSQDSLTISRNLSINRHIDGTLLKPNNDEKYPLAIIIAGSGPTDRDGNQNLMQNNSLKKLAEGLAEYDIATFRYDKRVVKQIKTRNIDPNTIFDDFVSDAVSVLQFFKNKEQYSKIYLIGHSQGSLVAMLAAKDAADGFISLAGAGRPIDEIIVSQIAAMDSSLVAGTQKTFKIMKKGQTTSEYPIALSSIFREDLQPFIINWMQYDPAEIIKTLKLPVLIINGTKDLQVSVEEAELLKEASKIAELKVIESMNHVLFLIEGNSLENSKSYNESARPIAQELVEVISKFINN